MPRPEAARSSASAGPSKAAGDIVQAANGQVTASFDVTQAAQRTDPFDKLPNWHDDVDLSDDSLDVTCLAILEQQTGVVFDPSWLTAPLPTFRVPDPDVLLKDVKNAREP